MPSVSGPFTPTAGVAIQTQNPLQGSANVPTKYAVVKNISPFLLTVSTGAASSTALIDPYTTDLIPLDPSSGQELSIMPEAVGALVLQSLTNAVYVTWYQGAGDSPGGNYPAPVPLGTQLTYHDLTVVNTGTGTPWIVSGFIPSDTIAVLTINATDGDGSSFYFWLFDGGSNRIIGSPVVSGNNAVTITFNSPAFGGSQSWQLMYGTNTAPVGNVEFIGPPTTFPTEASSVTGLAT